MSSIKNQRDSDHIEAELHGKALRIYWYLLGKREALGVREIQRTLGFSSPSVAHHHLENLLSLRLVDRDQYGRYLVAQRVDVGVLQAFSQVGHYMLPRFVFYAIFFTTLLLLYFAQHIGSLDLYSLTFGLVGMAIAWYETIRAWRKRPF